MHQRDDITTRLEIEVVHADSKPPAAVEANIEEMLHQFQGKAGIYGGSVEINSTHKIKSSDTGNVLAAFDTDYHYVVESAQSLADGAQEVVTIVWPDGAEVPVFPEDSDLPSDHNKFYP